MPEKDFSILEKRLGIKFRNQDLLRQAMVHRSYINEHPNFYLHHNERLEFLGDAVLELIVTEALYRQYPHTAEGDLTSWRASLVNAKMLAQVGREIGLEDFLYLSRGEARDKNSKARQYIVANAVEALIGAIYEDRGLAAAKKFIDKFILAKLDYILKHKLYQDPKSRFQEKAQELYSITPHYKVLKEEGPDHAKKFEVGLYLGRRLIARGQGTSKHEAQVEAAQRGLEKKGW